MSERIFSFNAKDIETPAATVSSGCFSLHTLEDTLLFPWKYREVKLNINSVYFPAGETAFCIFSHWYERKCLIVRPVFGCEAFPTSIEVKAGGLLPVKLNAGYPIATLMFFPVEHLHLYNMDFPDRSI